MPEWSMPDTTGDDVGTFDSSGAFVSTKVGVTVDQKLGLNNLIRAVSNLYAWGMGGTQIYKLWVVHFP